MPATGASLTIIGPIRLPRVVVDLAPREAARARTAILRRIERVDKVFHLVEEADIRGWLASTLPPFGVAVEDLSTFYATSGPNLGDVHLEVAEWILQAPRVGLETAAVFSGRPELCIPPAAAVATLAIADGLAIASAPHVFSLPLSRRR